MARSCSYKYKGEVFETKEAIVEYIENARRTPDTSWSFPSRPMAMAPNYPGGRKMEGSGNFFYMRQYNPEDLASGKKSISIRPDNLEGGTYKFGEDFYKITNRGLKKLTEVKETPQMLRDKSMGDTEIKYAHIEEFFNNKVPMYVYDIKKLAREDAKSHMMAADFHGNIGVKRGAPNLVTGKGIFDSYITALADYVTRLKDERIQKKGNTKAVQDLTERIKSQEQVLAQLQKTKSIRTLVEIGTEQLRLAEENGLKEGASLLEVSEAQRLAKSWKNITQIVDIAREGKDEMQLEIVEAAREIQNDSSVLFDKLGNILMSHIRAAAEKNEIALDKVTDKNGNLIVKDVNKIGAFTISSSFSGNEIDHLVDAIMEVRNRATKAEIYDFETEEEQKSFELLGSKTANTDFLTEEFDVAMFDESTGKDVSVKHTGIITMYDRTFYKEMDEKYAEAQETNKWKEYYAYERKHFSYELTEQGKKAFENYMDAVRSANILDTDSEGNYIYDEEEIEKVRKKYDPAVFQDYLDNNKTKKIQANNGAKWFTKTPQNVPINPAYARLTQAQKDYHQWYSETFMSAYENSDLQYQLGQADIDEKFMSFSSEVMQGLGGRVKHLGKETGAWLKSSFYRTATTTKTGITTRTLTGSEHIKVPFRNVMEFIPNNGKFNPREILQKFKMASIAFRNKSQVEELLNVVNDLVKTADKIEENNAGSEKKRLSGETLTTKNPTNRSARMEATIMNFLTDRFTDTNTTVGNVAAGEKGFSGGQAIDTLNSLTRVRFMAFAPISAAGNLLMGLVNNLSYAASGQYFTDKEYAKAAWLMKGAPFKFLSSAFKNGNYTATEEAKLIAEIMHRYNMLGDITEELVYGDSIISQLFILQKGGEFLAQGSSTIAQLLHEKTTNKEGKEMPLFSYFKLVDGRLTFDTTSLPEDSKYHDPDTIAKFMDKAKAVNEKIHGDYSHVLLGKKTPLGRAAFLFRTWLPMAVKDRFGAEYNHRVLGAQKGRYRSAWHIVKGVAYNEETGWGFNADQGLNLLKTFFKLVPGLGKVVDLKLGDEISEIDRHNIEMFVREVQMLIALSLTTMMAKAAYKDDDDDDNEKYSLSFLKYVYNQGERMQSELSMFAVPTSLTQIMSNVIPLTQTLVDAEGLVSQIGQYVVNPEKDIYQRGFRKGNSKVSTKVQQFLPLTRSFQSTWSSFAQMYGNQPQKPK